jgi:hypothetical protein
LVSAAAEAAVGMAYPARDCNPQGKWEEFLRVVCGRRVYGEEDV